MATWKVGETYATRGGGEARVTGAGDATVRGRVGSRTMIWRSADGRCLTLTTAYLGSDVFDLVPPELTEET